MSRRAARGSAVVAWALCGACTEPNPYLPAADASTSTGSDVGSDPDTTAASTTMAPGTDDGSSSSGGAAGCAALGMACVEAAPRGFFGPVAWLEGPADAPLSCAAPFERGVVEAFSEISAPAASCACECGPLTASCGSASVDRHGGAVCAGGVQDTLALEPGCNPVGGVGWASNTSFRFEAGPPVGACVPVLTKEVVPAAFLTRHAACTGSFSSDGCEPGQLCIPPPADPFHARTCVWQEGDVACPEGSAYAERTLLHRDIDDVRDCEPCSCAVAPEPCEGAVATLSTMVNCSVAVAMLAPGDCEGDIGGPSILGVHYVEGTPPAACDPAQVMPTGDAAGIDPVTFCCTR